MSKTLHLDGERRHRRCRRRRRRRHWHHTRFEQIEQDSVNFIGHMTTDRLICRHDFYGKFLVVNRNS